MKKVKLFVLAFFSLWVVGSHAQPGSNRLSPEKKEKMHSMRVAFLTTQLELTPDEAKVFWPVYDKYQSELQGLRESRRSEMKKLRENKESLTDKDYEKIFDSEITFRQAELEIMKKYQVQLKNTLPIAKLSRLHRAENEFKRELLDKMKSRREGAPGEQKRYGE